MMKRCYVCKADMSDVEVGSALTLAVEVEARARKDHESICATALEEEFPSHCNTTPEEEFETGEDHYEPNWDGSEGVNLVQEDWSKPSVIVCTTCIVGAIENVWKRY